MVEIILPYEKVQYIHRHIHPHHGEFYLKHGWLFWDDLVIDWECSHFTKLQSPWVAVDVLPKECDKLYAQGATQEQVEKFRISAWKSIVKMGLNKAIVDNWGASSRK